MQCVARGWVLTAIENKRCKLRACSHVRHPAASAPRRGGARLTAWLTRRGHSAGGPRARRAPAAGAVQKASADLVRNWGRLAEKWVLAEQRASEQFFSREFAPLVPRGGGRGGGGGNGSGPLPGPGEAVPARAPPRAPALRACLGRGVARPAQSALGAARRVGPGLGPCSAGLPGVLRARLL